MANPCQTRRKDERDLLMLLLRDHKGMRSREIAQRMGIGYSTVTKFLREFDAEMREAEQSGEQCVPADDAIS